MSPAAITASAPGKIILFGEHAVVYGEPAIAAPVAQVRATATVEPADERGVLLRLPDLQQQFLLGEANEQPLIAAIEIVQQHLNLAQLPDMCVTVTSEIPIASGMGSGAATAAALIRALLLYLGHTPETATINQLTYEVEKLHHGTPSGIDNTVVVYEEPVYFVKQAPSNLIERFDVGQPIHLLIADTGVRSSTKKAVADLRALYEQDREKYGGFIAECGKLAAAAKGVIERGDVAALGEMMWQNHALLCEMGVGSAELNQLVAAAKSAGALGAKLSGGGRGGNMIALVTEATIEPVKQQLLAAGATNVLYNQLK